MREAALVAAGGALGTLARYAVARISTAWLGPNPWGTFFVNITGALLMGVVMGLAPPRVHLSPVTRAALTIGVLGGYTTFSSWAYQIWEQGEFSTLSRAAINLGGSVVLGLAAVGFGLALGRRIG